MSVQNHDSVAISSYSLEPESLEKLERSVDPVNDHARLIGPNGEITLLTESFYQTLYGVFVDMAGGKVISLSPSDRELSTQEAADILNVSRPYFIDKILKPGEIPHVKVGNRHRVRLQDLMAYKEKRDQKRQQILREHTQVLQAEGFYDE